jgi:glycosyltransferase involved in cell wall biosynthesis
VTGPPRIAHLIAEYSGHEAMGRTVAETAARVPGEHHLVTVRAHDTTSAFAWVQELGGTVGLFPAGRSAAVGAALDRIRPDLIHLHAGALGPLQTMLAPLRGRPGLLTVYGWPTLPGPATWRRASIAELRSSNVLRPRVALTTALPAVAAAAALRATGFTTVLTPDPRVETRLGHRTGIRVVRLPSGAPIDGRRARFDRRRPVIVFAGRAETVRGLDTLVAAFALVRARVPAAVLRLLLIARPELPAIVASLGHAGLADAVEVVTEPVDDLLAELAAAQVGTWPFKFDYTTSPPAMAVAEAMAVGLPVVATDVACVRAVLVPGVNGLAVPPADPVALADAIAHLLTDQAAWHRYAEAGARSVRERLGWDRAAEVTAAAYAATLRPDP